jgi:hypothetical protein
LVGGCEVIGDGQVQVGENAGFGFLLCGTNGGGVVTGGSGGDTDFTTSIER